VGGSSGVENRKCTPSTRHPDFCAEQGIVYFVMQNVVKSDRWRGDWSRPFVCLSTPRLTSVFVGRVIARKVG
jgi:hypothetical protein